MAEPEPDNEAYKAPLRSSTRLTSRNSGYLGKTTCSKSFSIPVRTRSRSGVSARPPPRVETPDKADSLSQLETMRLNSFILSEGFKAVNLEAFRLEDLSFGY